MLNLDEKQLKNLHTKSNLKKFMEYVQTKNSEKVEKMCTQGLDPNYHDAQGETPLTLAAGVPNNRGVIVALVGGGAHIDFRNSEGQTAMHKTAFLSSLENAKTLIELGASPNYRDPIGLTPLYYNMLTTDANDQVAEMLLREAADIGVTDMHGNHEIHQACKNGLVKHVEHLLYFGANIDAENVNGNSPLHVCAVNNRAECARVLLFRGANHMVVNKQDQTALHVAHIISNHQVAEVIQCHNPSASVPYRGTPQYSTRRRLSSTLMRRRSLSQSSICSHDIYRAPLHSRQNSAAPSPTPSRISRSTITPSEYGTMRRVVPDHIRMAAGHEPNTPRILVIPRGPKGFGFILRGAKHVDPSMDFEPTPLVPALQFFEGVDMSGMAMRAGLRPGDYLLEIDGIDVRCASHDDVVQLIQQASDTITLKVITVDPAETSVHNSGTIRRMPSDNEEYYSPGQIRQQYNESKCASVRHRGTGRRISAAELESLMVRQGERHNYHPINFEQEVYMTGLSGNLSNGGSTKKYNSVSDLKRRKQQRGGASPQMQNCPGLPRTNFEYQSPDIMHQSTNYGMRMGSAPNITRQDSYDSEDAPTPLPTDDLRRDVGEYSRPLPPKALRPKTPPPPVPIQNGTQRHYNSQQASSSKVSMAPPAPAKSMPGNAPPPPPPPPPDLLKTSASAPVGLKDAIKSVQLKKPSETSRPPIHQNSTPNRMGNGSTQSNSNVDFQADLRNALAKRRSKVAHDEDEEDRGDTPHARFNGLTLRETVRENVEGKTKQHSPPGIAHKKDSGYTSSRTSLEPEIEDKHDQHHTPHFSLDHSPSPNRVTLISQHIEDNYGRGPKDNMSISSSLSSTLSASSMDGPPKCIPTVPPIDYEDPDSGTGDSDGELRNADGSSFDRKGVIDWSCADVLAWLDWLGLSEYRDAFRSRGINGRTLRRFDRAAFTQLGVTRIAHRQQMESSIRTFLAA
ncbi:hypothetical protein WR25_11144 isoform B [Diploscapter pachys]|nr:hypothetical protein WR25_11144 isoform B [Diploscapter pachys]